MEINDDLLISYLLKEGSPEQVRDIDAWRLEHSDNELRFRRFELIWETSKILELKEPINSADSLSRLKSKIYDQRNDNEAIIKLKPNHSWIRVVAALVLICGLAWFYINTGSVETLQSTTGQLVKVDTLIDGSVVTLNKHTSLEYTSSFGNKRRELSLTRGEAFFNVKPNQEKPFIIKSGKFSIRVVGTSFNVKLKNGQLEVIVETGKVQVFAEETNIFLEPGEKITVSEYTKVLKKEKNPDRLYNYYRTKEFVADDTPLWRMVQVLNEAYDSQIVIQNPAIKNLPLNTAFKNESLDDILQVISRTFKITVSKKQRQIILK